MMASGDIKVSVYRPIGETIGMVLGAIIKGAAYVAIIAACLRYLGLI